MSFTEEQRLEALHRYNILDTPLDERFDRITSLAADLFDVPIALISLLDHQRQWFKSCYGLDVSETPRSWAFCEHAVKGGPGSVMVVTDALAEPRFSENPLVVGAPLIRFYAGAVLSTPEGACLGTLCVIDSTARRQPSERELRRLKLLAQMVMDELQLSKATAASIERLNLLEMAETMAGIGHWRLDPKGHVSWSDQVYKIHGVSKETFDPNLDASLGFYHPDDQVTINAQVQAALEHQQPYSFQLRLRRSDGALRHVTAKGQCEIDAFGKTAAVYGVFQDVTEAVEALEAVERSEVRYRLLTENAREMIAHCKIGGEILFVSPGSEATLGYRPEELLGRRTIDLMHADDVEPVIAYYQALFALGPGGVAAPFQFRAYHKDGRLIWLEGQPKVFFGENGLPNGVQDVVRDVTSRKQLELELEQARREAEAAAAVKTEFLSNMSHELRTPLTSILGYSSLLESEQDLSSLGRQSVERIAGSGQALLAIVNDILEFSKLEAGQVEIDRRATDPRRMLSEALGLLELQAAEKALTLVLHVDETVPPLLMLDDVRVRQILLNFLSNAVKFTHAGSVCLKARYDAAGERLQCEVADTGAGISEEALSRLFKRFSQVDASTTRAHGGTGLGLAICKGLAEAMGGAVGADSVVDQGSRFWFELPSPLAAEAPRTAGAVSEETERLRGLRLLVADDNALNRELIRLMASAYGVVVTEAAGGVEAVRLAQETPFDLILMDIRMPGMDGPAAAKHIRDGHGCNDLTPIVAFSANDASELSSQTWGALFDDQLSKPVLSADLVQKLLNWAPACRDPIPTARRYG